MPRTLNTAYLSNHQYFTARRDAYELESGKIVDPYFVVELPPSACAVAITENNEVVLVKQFRYPVREELLELPGGFVNDGEEANTAILRELQEETGYAFAAVHQLSITYANPGVLNNATSLHIALGGKKVSEQSLDENEEISIELVSLKELEELLLAGKIKQSMHALCVFYALDYLRRANIV